MTTLAMINGRIAPAEQATVSVFDRGFLYGDSVFETIATRDGRPMDLDAHLSRLQDSAQQVHISMPAPLTTIAEEVHEALAAAGNVESTIRVMVTRGQGDLGLDPSTADNPIRVILVSPLRRPPERAYEEGISVITYRTQRVNEHTDAAGAKVGNYLVAVLALRQATRSGATEALVVDGHGRVVEGATSNIFLVCGGLLVTPPEETGILAGITRARVLELAQREGINVQMRAPNVEELIAADEVFISSSIRQLLPVVRIDGRPVGSGRPGPIARRLLRGYRALATGEDSASRLLGRGR
jgi:branched-chain amino acid aminotransferase